MKAKPVRFKLADGFSALRVSAVTGELAIDDDGHLDLDDPAAIALLDNHPAAERAPEKEAKRA